MRFLDWVTKMTDAKTPVDAIGILYTARSQARKINIVYKEKETIKAWSSDEMLVDHIVVASFGNHRYMQVKAVEV